MRLSDGHLARIPRGAVYGRQPREKRTPLCKRIEQIFKLDGEIDRLNKEIGVWSWFWLVHRMKCIQVFVIVVEIVISDHLNMDIQYFFYLRGLL